MNRHIVSVSYTLLALSGACGGNERARLAWGFDRTSNKGRGDIQRQRNYRRLRACCNMLQCSALHG